MKILAIFVLLLSLSLGLSIFLDIVTGIPLASSIRNLKSYWGFMGIPAYMLLAVFIVLPLISGIADSRKKKRN
ncbi:hypothetical protein K0T92_05030 [Paenibacillus oenotherae]|uniref:Uncharacterized protein n=1 Tax=Paenibacillus oenotherae TaxID=1435645 RepID=A0ABS7D2E5_9BACL|nr:hypothetical protein [Paenibacillus oenotherae]MBW7474097.1 hypothetical protein [Paenibacillus oenotherae]